MGAVGNVYKETGLHDTLLISHFLMNWDFKAASGLFALPSFGKRSESDQEPHQTLQLGPFLLVIKHGLKKPWG